ncbi:hypothetical protein Mapa_013339 [Marchantia paleacea]|nr:hypothetical protein Mapa_013339 [Marchantia paleacea]
MKGRTFIKVLKIDFKEQINDCKSLRSININDYRKWDSRLSKYTDGNTYINNKLTLNLQPLMISKLIIFIYHRQITHKCRRVDVHMLRIRQ